jgi:hypothetical protein
MTMKYNLALTNLLSTASGTKVLTESELSSLVNENKTSSSVTVSGSEQLSLLFNLKARYNLDDLFYYRNAATTEDIVIFARQNDLDNWREVLYTVSGTKISATLSGTFDRYQTFNIVHTVSSGVAVPLEVEVYTSEEEVRFGSPSEGDVEDYPVGAGDSEQPIQEVFIRNVDNVDHEYFVLIEDNVSHNSVEVATASSGTFYGIRDNNIALPSSFPWSNGSFSGTEVDGSDRVVIVSGTEGIYYSPVFNISSLQGHRIFWEALVSGTAEVDTILDINAQNTVGVRLSNVSPEAPWVDGQLSMDSLWSTVSGSLPFVEYAKNTVVEPAYKDFVQFKVELSGDTEYPKLTSLGMEFPISITISGGDFSSVFVRTGEDVTSGSAELLAWYFEPRTLLN